VFFTATDSAHGFEIWKSDGTSRGTKLVEDITPGPEGSYGINNLVSADNQIYFLNNGALWASGGTSNNTNPVNDRGLNNVCCIQNMTMAGNQLAFTGYSPAYGSELWMGSANCRSVRDDDQAVLNMLKPTEESDGSTAIYPNPANNILNVSLSSSLEGIITITVVDVNGAALFTKTLGSGQTNAQINIANLPAGVYFVKIISSNSSENTVKKFVKM
jgi:ELWxxDGT repeat protein